MSSNTDEAALSALQTFWHTLPPYEKLWCNCKRMDGTPIEGTPTCRYCVIRAVLAGRADTALASRLQSMKERAERAEKASRAMCVLLEEVMVHVPPPVKETIEKVMGPIQESWL